MKWGPLLLVAALVASAALSLGGPGPAPWVSTGGPLGGLGYDVRIHPATKSVMYVTDNNAGVILSTNGGRTWKPSNAGITVKGGPTGDAYTIFSLTVDPNDPNIVWAGTNGDNKAFGVFKSTDGGATWALKSAGIADAGYGIVFRGFTVQPGSSAVVYAQAELPTPVHGREFDRVQGVVYKTTDGGESWTQLWPTAPALGDNLARYVIVDPGDANTLYLSTGIFDREAYNSDCAAGVAGAGGVGVLKSTDGGAHWSAMNGGLTDLYVGSLRMHPTNRLVLFAATGNNACSGGYEGSVVSGLFRTIDGGATWSKVISGDIMTAVAFSPSDPSVVYAGSAGAFYRSADGGASFTRYTKPSGWEWGPPGVRAGVPIDVVVDPDDPNLLYANNYGGGVFRSRDGARSWEIWSQGYSGADVHAAVVADASAANVLAIGRSGPFKSPNYGLDWIGIGNGAATFPEWYSIAAQPGHPEVILVADEHQGVILRSTDGGGDFVEVLRNPGADAADPAKREGFKALSFAPSNPAVVYAGVAKDRGTIDSGTPFGNVLYKSVNGGATFTVPSTDLDGLNVYRFLVAPADANTVWAATSGGLFRSVNGGTSWTKLTGGNGGPFAAVAVDPSSPSAIVASEKNVGIWVSTDGGATWPGGPYNTGFTNASPAVVALAFDPSGGGAIYAGDFYSGVYRSTDGGKSWSGWPDAGMSGLAVRAVKDLAIAGGVVYATTQGGGVFRLGGPAIVPSPSQAAFSSVVVGSSSAPRTFTLHNTGGAARTLYAKTTGSSEFTFANDTCMVPYAMAAAATCSFDVVFSPSSAGVRTATLTVTSDDPFGATYPVPLSGTALAAVSISPSAPSVAPRDAQTFTASGGSGSGYTWSLVTNNSGATIGAASGAYTAGATPSVTDVLRATDSLGNTADLSVTVTAGVSITPGVAGVPPRGSRSFSASGGKGSGYAWSFVTNASGGSIDPSTGLYTAGATANVADVVRAADPLGNAATATANVTAGVSITASSASAPPRGSVTFGAGGGSGAGYAWSLDMNASGASLDASTGAYTAGPTPNVTDVVRVTDSLSNFATQSVTVTAGVSIAPSAASVATHGTLIFTASGGSGTGLAWSLATNSSGGSIDTATGAYQAGSTGTVTDVVRVTDSLGNAATASVSVTAPAQPPAGQAPGKSGGCGSTGAEGGGLLALAAWIVALRLSRRTDLRALRATAEVSHGHARGAARRRSHPR
ncbi:MAG TPA: choice-of-anchor D domain-containing protein [Anaeromyxobacter sp.]